MQVFTDAAAARQAKMDDSPVLLVQKARADLKKVLSEAAEEEQEPSLAAAGTAATALAAAQRALAAEALLASLTLSLAEAAPQVDTKLTTVPRKCSLNTALCCLKAASVAVTGTQFVPQVAGQGVQEHPAHNAAS